METKEDMEAIMEKIPKGKAEMELKVVARYNSYNQILLISCTIPRVKEVIAKCNFFTPSPLVLRDAVKNYLADFFH